VRKVRTLAADAAVAMAQEAVRGLVRGMVRETVQQAFQEILTALSTTAQEGRPDA